MLEGTALGWVEAMTHNRDWLKQRDTARIREAFVIVAATRDYWPSPRAFMAAIPPIEQRPALPPKPADPVVAERAIATIGDLLHVEPLAPGDPERPLLHGRAPLSEAARQLASQINSQTYGRDGKTAAAGPDA